MMKLKKHERYVNRPLQPYEKEEDGFHPALPPEGIEMLKDPVLESDDYRINLKEDEGDISIIVEAGDQLGQIRIAVQYEGEKGKNDKCLSSQGDLIRDVSAWLGEIYSKFQGDFEVEMISQLCPRGDTRPLLNQVTSDVYHGVGPNNDISVKP